MTCLIDTNIISEVRKGDRCDPCVARWYASIRDEDLYLSVLVLGEIRKGVEQVRSRNPDQAVSLERWLKLVTEAFEDRILPVDQDVCDEWGRMNARRSLPTIDALLAATARVHHLTFVTRNVGDVADTGVNVLNPFMFQG